jgi:hypothetical protein
MKDVAEHDKINELEVLTEKLIVSGRRSLAAAKIS